MLASKIHRAGIDNGPQSMIDVIKLTADLIGKHSIMVQHPHCIAHLHTPPLLPSISAEMFISALNQSMDSWDQSSAANFLEQEVIDWLLGQTGLN